MAGATRLEINFNRLLGQCQLMAEDKENRDWRFDKYLGSLQNFLADLEKSQSKPSKEVLLDYKRKVDFLLGLSEAEKTPNVLHRAKEMGNIKSVNSYVANTKTKILQSKVKASCEEDVRSELFGTTSTPPSSSQDSTSTSSTTALRQRHQNPQEGGGDAEDIDTIIQHHRRLQERLADEMLQHTRDLKYNITEAGKIVSTDTKRITESHSLADSNMNKLKTESERLDAYNQTCSWWIWIMLGCVVLTFLGMIPFMRIFSK